MDLTSMGILPSIWAASVWKKNFILSAECPNLLNGLTGTDFIIDGHYGDEDGIVADGRFQVVQVDAAGRVLNGQVRDIVPLLFERAARIEDALVLGLGRNDVLLVLLRLAVKVRRSLDAHVVRFRGSRREDDLLGRGAD